MDYFKLMRLLNGGVHSNTAVLALLDPVYMEWGTPV